MDSGRYTARLRLHGGGRGVMLGVAKSRMAAGQHLGRCKLRTSPMWRAIFDFRLSSCVAVVLISDAKVCTFSEICKYFSSYFPKYPILLIYIK